MCQTVSTTAPLTAPGGLPQCQSAQPPMPAAPLGSNACEAKRASSGPLRPYGSGGPSSRMRPMGKPQMLGRISPTSSSLYRGTDCGANPGGDDQRSAPPITKSKRDGAPASGMARIKRQLPRSAGRSGSTDLVCTRQLRFPQEARHAPDRSAPSDGQRAGANNRIPQPTRLAGARARSADNCLFRRRRVASLDRQR